MISASAGTICTSRIAMMNALRPRNRKRETATAARNAMNSASTSTSSVTVRLFFTAVQKKSRSNTLR